MNKSNESQGDMLNNLNPKYYDIILIQEPYIDFLGRTRATHKWTVIYPLNHGQDGVTSRSVILVNKRLNTNSWKQIRIDSPDITGIQIKTPQRKIEIYNIYNDCNHSTSINTLKQYLRRQATQNITTDFMIWAGDFNRHHPLWDEERNSHLFTKANLMAAQIVIDAMSDYGMHMALPKNIPTLVATTTGNHTRPDNMMCSEDMKNLLLHCQTIPSRRPPTTDHMPIFTVFAFELERTPETPRRNFRATAWDVFHDTLDEELQLTPPPKTINSTQHFDSTLHAIMQAIDKAVVKAVPVSKPSPHTKRWWNSKLTEMKKTASKAQRLAYEKRHHPEHSYHNKHKELRNKYSDEIRIARKDCWDTFLEEAVGEDIWLAQRIVTGPPTDGGNTRIPTLRNKLDNGQTINLDDNETKSKAFFDSFFPVQHVPPATYDESKYPPAAFDYSNITDHQIEKALRKLAPFKAPGPDSIPNAVLKYNQDLLIPYLGPLFRATFDLSYYPTEWKNYNTIVLRKPGKTDYTQVSAYRGIALLSTISKVLSACVAEDIVYWTEQHGLLPQGHFGARPGRTTTDALHTMLTFINKAWRQKKIAVFLFLDVKGAFPSVVVHRLLHDLRLRGVPRQYTDWLHRKLSNRTTTINFDGYISPPLQITHGVDQGCPLSAVLYQYYNAALIEVADKKNNEEGLGFIDDVALGVMDVDMNNAFGKIEHLFNKPNGAKDWSTSHHSTFSHTKDVVTAFTRKTLDNPTNPKKRLPLPRPPLILDGCVIPYRSHTKHLGFQVDEKLRFREHASYALAKGTKWAMQVRRLSRPSSGMPAHHMRQLFNTVIVPRMLYAADIFCADKLKIPKSNSGFLAKMAQVQRMLSLQITGAMRSSPNDSIDVYADLLPFRLLVQKLCHRATVRLAALPTTHPLHNEMKSTRKIVKHRSPIHNLKSFFGITPTTIEKISAVRGDPKTPPETVSEILNSKEKAKKQHIENNPSDTCIYTDGSGYEEGIGAAAVMTRPDKPTITLQYHLGKQSEHTVYEAELVGILLALHLIKEYHINSDVTIATDNQAAIMALDSQKPKPSHHLVDKITSAHEQLLTNPRHFNLQIKFQWIPAHSGIPGNETADMLAKTAAQDTTSPLRQLPKTLHKPIPVSTSALKAHFHQELRNRHIDILKESPRFDRLTQTDPTIPSPTYRKIMAALPRKHASIITQLRTGHIPLAKHLHRINKAESPICPLCNTCPETVHHYLLRCPAHDDARTTLIWKLGKIAFDIPKLLSDETAIPHLLRYVAQTQRFKKNFGEIKKVTLETKKKKKEKEKRTQNRTANERAQPT